MILMSCKMVHVLLALLISIASYTAVQSCNYIPDSNSNRIQCEPLHPDDLYCRTRLNLSRTSFPNFFNHTNQQQARDYLFRNIAQISPLLNCSIYAPQFLCYSAYPLCVPGQFKKVLPCRELCVSVRESCSRALGVRGLKWPTELNCNLFPPYGSSTLCIWSGECGTTVLPPPGNTENPNTVNHNSQGLLTNCTGHLTYLVNDTSTSFGGIQKCTESCQGVYFEQGEVNFILIWITAWCLLCLIVSVLVFATYVLNFRSIPRLEGPIYYISLCYTCVALVYTISLAIGRNTLICNHNLKNEFNESAVIVSGLDYPLCVSIFSLLYYFTLTTWSWWVVLTTEWFWCSLRSTNVNKKWRLLFHALAWGLPLVFLVIALSFGHVSGDPISHTCWISKHQELPFLIVPLVTCLVVCSVIIVISFARVVNLQNKTRSVDSTSPNIEHATLVRVGVFCTVYLVPMGILLCTYIYEYWYRAQWESDYVACQSSTSKCTQNSGPILPIVLAKIAASLFMGLVSLFWMLGKSSVNAWRKACCICRFNKQNSGSFDPNPVLQFEQDISSAKYTLTESEP